MSFIGLLNRKEIIAHFNSQSEVNFEVHYVFGVFFICFSENAENIIVMISFMRIMRMVLDDVM